MTYQASHTHEEIARQIHLVKPEHLIPGRHVGMKVCGQYSVQVRVIPTGVTATVTYLPGPDSYDLTVTRHDGIARTHERIYCDQLGDLIFGVDATEWTEPTCGFVADDEL